jgi:hypothetical protein
MPGKAEFWEIRYRAELRASPCRHCATRDPDLNYFRPHKPLKARKRALARMDTIV